MTDTTKTSEELISPLKENKMGTMRVSRLLITMSIPMMISMFVQALYNIIDSMFVSQLGENALTALSLAFPAQNLMIAVGSGTGVGINALLSRSLGEKNTERANKTAVNGIFLAFLTSIAFALLGYFLVPVFFRTQTNIPEILEYGVDYLSICTKFSFGFIGQMTFERLLQATGKTFYSMISQAFGAIVNIILDPIMIFGYFGFPRMEVTGAALATVIGQTLAMTLGIILNLKVNKEIDFKFRGFRPSREIISKIYAVGIPTAIMISIGSVMTYSLNRILLTYTATAAAVFGVYFRLQGIVFMPIFGLNNGMIPIVSYNYGARNKKRLIHAIKLSMTYAIVIMVIGFVMFQIFPAQLLSLFNATADMIAIGVPAFRIISISFLFAGFCIISGSVFQALGNGIPSMITSTSRQLIALIPLALLLSRIGGLNAIWWAFPLSEILAVVITAFFLKYFYNNKIKVLG